MKENDLRDLESLCAQVEDPRIERTTLHRWRDIIILAICGVMCGAEGWVEIEECGKAKEAFFTDVLDVPNGIPSQRVFESDHGGKSGASVTSMRELAESLMNASLLCGSPS